MKENFAHAQRGQLFNMLGRSTGPGSKTSARSPAIREDAAHVAAASPLPLRPGWMSHLALGSPTLPKATRAYRPSATWALQLSPRASSSRCRVFSALRRQAAAKDELLAGPFRLRPGAPGLAGVPPGCGSTEWGQTRHPATEPRPGSRTRPGRGPGDASLSPTPPPAPPEVAPRDSRHFFLLWSSWGPAVAFVSRLNVLGLGKGMVPELGPRAPTDPAEESHSGFHPWERSPQGGGQAGGSRLGRRTRALSAQPRSQRPGPRV